MSAPAMNAVLPSGASVGPNPITPLSLTVSPVKTSPPPPVAPKPQANHIAAISLVPESKLKTPEKPKETPAEPSKPTSNGVDTSPVSKAEEPPAASASSGDLPAASSTDAAPAEVPTTEAAPQPEPAVAPTPAPVEVASLPVTSEPTPPAPASDGTVVSAKPDPGETATPDTPAEENAAEIAEEPKPKAAKAQGAKRRREPAVAEAKVEGGTPEKKIRIRRMRAPVSPYQSPLPEITTVIKHSLREKTVNTPKATDEKLIVFYKNEFLAVRNAEGSFYLCQTMQNVYRTSHKIRIRWLSRDEEESNSDGGIYAADFYDATDFECILTSVSLQKQGKNKYKMPAVELDRVENILKRAIDVEKGVSQKPDVTEEHPDGLDVSLYKDESQLQKTRKRAEKRKRSPTVKRSPKKVVAKTKKPKSSPVASGSRAAAAAPTASTSKAKPAPRKPPAKRTAPPPITPRKKFRTERNSARVEKEDDSPVVKTSKKTAKVTVSAVKAKSPKTNNKAKKPEKPVPAPKPVKKIEKVKSKTLVAVAAASSSSARRAADKPKKTAAAVAAPAPSDKRSTRKKGRK